MRIRLNGKLREIPGEETDLSRLLRTLGVNTEGIAVAVNDEVVPANRFSETPIHEGDVVEVIQAVAGG